MPGDGLLRCAQDDTASAQDATQPTCTTYREVATLKHRTVSTTSRSSRMRRTQVIPGTAMLAFLAVLPMVAQCQAQAPRSGPAQSSPQPRPIEGKVGARDRGQGAGASLGAGVPPRRPDAGHRAPGPAPPRGEGRPALEAAAPACRRSPPKGQGGLLDVALDRSSRRTAWSTSPMRSPAKAERAPRWRADGWATAAWRTCR